jgi:hypothetical protein
MQRASQQAPTQTTATPETSRAATAGPAQAHPASAYSGNRAALRRLAAAYPNVQRSLLGEFAAAEPRAQHCFPNSGILTFRIDIMDRLANLQPTSEGADTVNHKITSFVFRVFSHVAYKDN